MVIATFNGKRALMLQVANGRHQSMVEAEFRIIFHRDELMLEGDYFRHFYELKLMFDRLIVFPAIITLRHIIDETSPLHGMDLEALKECGARFMVSVVCVDTVIPAPMQSQQDYDWPDIRFDEHFVDVYSEASGGRWFVDYSRLGETEPVKGT
jgi:inward rectifier potassium channel